MKLNMNSVSNDPEDNGNYDRMGGYNSMLDYNKMSGYNELTSEHVEANTRNIEQEFQNDYSPYNNYGRMFGGKFMQSSFETNIMEDRLKADMGNQRFEPNGGLGQSNKVKVSGKLVSSQNIGLIAIMGVVFTAIMLLITLGSVGSYLKKINWKTTLAKTTEVQQRETVERRSRYGRRSYSTRRVTVYDSTYEYEVDGQKYTRNVVGSRSYPDSTFRVRYNPKRPLEVMRASKYGLPVIRIFITLVAGIVTIFACRKMKE